jgi:glucose-1-phosphate thymidylyltransferase
MTRIVEKPSEPISKLANIGLYHIRDSRLLFEGIDRTLAAPPGPSGEFYLTDAFQYMVDQGSRLMVAPVAGWYDCGKPETLLDTNRHLLETTRGEVAPGAEVDSTVLDDPVRIEEEVVLSGSRVGPNVTVERGARIVNSSLRDCIIGPGAVVEGSELNGSLVGGHARVVDFRGRLNVLDHSEVMK